MAVADPEPCVVMHVRAGRISFEMGKHFHRTRSHPHRIISRLPAIFGPSRSLRRPVPIVAAHAAFARCRSAVRWLARSRCLTRLRTRACVYTSHRDPSRSQCAQRIFLKNQFISNHRSSETLEKSALYPNRIPERTFGVPIQHVRRTDKHAHRPIRFHRRSPSPPARLTPPASPAVRRTLRIFFLFRPVQIITKLAFAFVLWPLNVDCVCVCVAHKTNKRIGARATVLAPVSIWGQDLC